MGDGAGAAAGFWGKDGAVPWSVGVEIGAGFGVYAVDKVGVVRFVIINSAVLDYCSF